jgi:hypothetical protein
MQSIQVEIVRSEIVSEQPFVNSADVRGVYVLTNGVHAQIAIPSPDSDKALLIKFKQPV